MRIKILLVNPYWKKLYNIYYDRGVTKRHQPLGLLYIASYLLSHGDYDIKVIDENNKKAELEKTIRQTSPDIVGLCSTTPLFPEVKTIAHRVKKINKNIAVVVGGAHVSAVPEKSLLECEDIDFIVRGEGEKTMQELTQAIIKNKKFSNINNITFRKGNKIVSTPDQPLFSNLDMLPFPDRSLIDMKPYNSISIMMSRGCPFNCTYCYPLFGKKVRFRDPANVAKEMEDIVRQYNKHHFNFVDETFTINKGQVYKLCDEIINRGLNKKIRWTCTTRVDCVDHDLLLKMKESGCELISFGVESGNAKILEATNKGISLEQAFNTFRLCKKVGMPTLAFFMLGHPGETEETITETINVAMKIDPLIAEFSYITPFPGTMLSNKVKSEKPNTDWGQYSYCTSAQLQHIPEDELIRYHRKAFFKFYMRPKKIIDILKHKAARFLQ